MPLIPRDGKQGDCPWLAERKRKYGRRWGMRDGLQGKKLNIARKLLRSAMDSGEQERAVAATNALLGIPDEDREKALRDINNALKECKGGEHQDVMQSRTLAFVLVNLQHAEWSTLDGWKQTLALLEDHSELLANSLVMGSANGTDVLGLETLAFLAACGAYCYDADKLQTALNRFLRKPEAFMGYYDLTNAIMNEGPEDLRQVAEDMEEKRVTICRENLAYGNNQEAIEASIELTMLVATGRAYLYPDLEAAKEEMLDLMRDPGIPDVVAGDYDNEEDAAEAAELARQRKQDIRDKAAAVLRLLQDHGMTMAVVVDGESPEELKKAEKLFRRLAAHGVKLHMEIEGGDFGVAREAMSSVPAEYIRPSVSPDEVMELVMAAVLPEGETPEDAEAKRAEAVSKLKPLQGAGMKLDLDIGCPAGGDPEKLADALNRSLDVLEMNDIHIGLTFSGEKAEEVMGLLGPRTQAGEGMIHLAAFAFLNAVFFPGGESAEEAEANRHIAIAQLKELRSMGVVLDGLTYPVQCPAETDPAMQAVSITNALDMLEANGIYPQVQFVGENAQAVAQHMGHKE